MFQRARSLLRPIVLAASKRPINITRGRAILGGYLEQRFCASQPFRFGMSLSASLSSEALLPSTKDTYGGVFVDCLGSPGSKDKLDALTPQEFEARLWSSLKKWRADGVRGVWLKIGVANAELIPVAIRLGFSMHHARPEYLLLNAWLPEDQPDKMPPCANFFVGVAGFVVNSRGEVLLVKEKTGPAAKLGIWKLPGGLVDQHEDIHDAVSREVKEETGISASFGAVSTIQSIHHVDPTRAGPSRTGSSDLYCICVLHPTDETEELKPQAEEIAACTWMPFDEMMKLPFYSQNGTIFNHAMQQAMSISRKDGTTFEGGLGVSTLDIGFRPGKVAIYSSLASRSNL